MCAINQRIWSMCMRAILPNNCHLNPTIYICFNCLLINSIQARYIAKTKSPYEPNCCFCGRLIVVSARTNNRHHHYQAPLRTKKLLSSAILNTTTSSASSPKTWRQSSPNLLTCRYKHAINLLNCDDCSVILAPFWREHIQVREHMLWREHIDDFSIYSCSFLKRTHSV